MDAGRAEFIQPTRRTDMFRITDYFLWRSRGAFGAVRQCVGLGSSSRQHVDCLTSRTKQKRKRRNKRQGIPDISVYPLSLSLLYYPRTRTRRHARINRSKGAKLPTLTRLQTVEPSSYNRLPWQPGPRSL